MGDFAPGNNTDRFITGYYSVSRNLPDQIADAQNTLAKKHRTEVVAADARQELAKELTQHWSAREETNALGDSERREMMIQPTRVRKFPDATFNVT